MTTIDLSPTKSLAVADLEELTRTEGDSWKFSHVRRVMELIRLIGIGQVYDETAATIATYLHDWGAYPSFQQPGVEHALRSRQVAETLILPRMELPQRTVSIILEAIEFHDYRDFRPVQSTEALLLREADFLDFLGVIGLVREYGRGAADPVSPYRKVMARREKIRDRFTLPVAREIAAARMARLQQCLEWLQEESFNWL